MKLKYIVKEVISDSIYEEMLASCKKCIEDFKLGRGFYRGISGSGAVKSDIEKIFPIKRTSKETFNFCNIFFDHFNPDAQKRTFCTIFTNNENTSKTYGKSHYVMIPDDAHITYGTQPDNYLNFTRGFSNLKGKITSMNKPSDGIEEFNGLIFNVIYLSKLYEPTDITNIDSTLDYNKIIDMLKKAIAELINNSTKAQSNGPVSEFINLTKTQDIEELLKQIFDGKTNVITTETIENYKYSTVPKEFWTESPVYILKTNSKYVHKLNPSKYYDQDKDDID